MQQSRFGFSLKIYHHNVSFELSHIMPTLLFVCFFRVVSQTLIFLISRKVDYQKGKLT